MRLNSLGSAAMGIGAGLVSIDGSEIARGGGACWMTENSVLYQRKPDPPSTHYVLEIYDTKRGEYSVVDQRGANELAAGGGVWAAWGLSGVRTSRGDHWPQAGLLDVSREGVIAICPDRQSGRGAEVHGPGAMVRRVPECRANAVRLVEDVLVWVQGGKVQAGGPLTWAPTTIAAPNYSPVPVLTSAGWWLLYQDGERLLLQPWGLPTGYIVHDQPTTYSPDAVALNAHTIRVAWSHTPGEAPASLRVKDIDLRTARVRLDRPTGLPPIEPPEPPVPEPNYLTQVQQARAEYRAVTPSTQRGWLVTNRAVELINMVDSKGNFGLVSKTSGTNWHGYSIDCLMRTTGETWDVLGDAEGEARPQWARTKPTGMTDPSKWRAHEDVGTEPPPDPPEPPAPPQPPSGELAAIRLRLDRLEGENAAQASQIAVLQSQTAGLQSQLGALRVTGSTGSRFGHAHPIDLTVG